MHDEEKCRKNLHRIDVSPDDWSPALERGQGFFVLVNLTNQGGLCMPSFIDPHKLTPNPANTIFDPLPDDVYQALKADISERGLLNPILATSDFTVIAGHHRLQAALELGLETIPVEIQDVSPQEAESRLIADNVLRRQLSLGEQARLIRRLKEEAGIKPGKRTDRTGHPTSAIIAEVPGLSQISDRKQYMLDHANDLIPPLFALFNEKRLPITVADSLAGWSVDQQQALYDAIGDSVTTLKVTDIQAAKKIPDTSALEAQMAALAAERDELQGRLEDWTAQTAVPPTDDESEASALVESLTQQLNAAEATRQEYADELARLKAQGPVERIVEKVVTVEKEVSVSDPAQAEQIATLEATLTATQAELTLLKTRRKDLQNYQQERDKLDREINDIKNELARLRDSTNVARYRVTQAAAIAQILRKIMKDGLSEVPQLEALLADSQGTIFQTDRDLALTVAQQLRRASDLILTAVQQFEDPIIYDVHRYHSEADSDHPVTQLLKEAHVLNDHNSIVSPAD